MRWTRQTGRWDSYELGDVLYEGSDLGRVPGGDRALPSRHSEWGKCKPASLRTIAPLGLYLDCFDIGLDHLCYQFLKTDGVTPAEFLSSFRWIADQMIDFGWSKVAAVDLHHDALAGCIDARLVHAAAAPRDPDADLAKGELDKLAYRMRLSGTQDKVVRLVLLKNAPHSLCVIPGMPPISLCVEIPEIEIFLQPEMYCRHGTRDFACYKGFAADRAFVVE